MCLRLAAHNRWGILMTHAALGPEFTLNLFIRLCVNTSSSLTGSVDRACMSPTPVWCMGEVLPCITPHGARTTLPPNTCHTSQGSAGGRARYGSPRRQLHLPSSCCNSMRGCQQHSLYGLHSSIATRGNSEVAFETAIVVMTLKGNGVGQ